MAAGAHLWGGRPHKHVAETHGAEQAVGAAHAGIGGDDKGVALHEGAQVQAPCQLTRRQDREYRLGVLFRPHLHAIGYLPV